MKNILDSIKNLLFILLPSILVLNFYGTYSFIDKSFFIICFFLFFFVLNKKQNKKEKRQIIWLLITSFIYSFLYVFGTYINISKNTISNGLFTDNILSKIFYVYGFSCLIYLLLSNLVDQLKRIKVEKSKLQIKDFFIIWICIFVSFIPYFISYFPGLMSPDSLFQYCQSIDMCALTNHHPVMHTYLIKIFSSIGIAVHNSNLGVALYSLFQMLVLSSGLSYVIYSIFNNFKYKRVVILLVAYYCLVPIFGYYSITMWKDIIFGILISIIMLQTYFFFQKENFTHIDKTITFIVIILASLFRSNGKIVVLLISILLIFSNRNRFKEVLLCFVTPLIISIIISGPIMSITNIPGGNLIETLGMPFRQLSGIVAIDSKMDKKDLEFINNIVPISTIKEEYDSNSIDNVKFSDDFDNEFFEENKIQFLSIYIKYFFRYPIKYCEIYLRNTYGFWYLDSEGYITHRWAIAENEYGLESRESFDKLNIEKYFNYFYGTPVFKWLINDSLCFYILIFALGLSIYKKQKNSFIVLCIPFIVWLTIMLASPVSYQPRYTFSLYCCMPIIIKIILEMFVITPKTRKSKKDLVKEKRKYYEKKR